MTPIRHLLRDIFNHDFSATKNSADFHKHFFKNPLAIVDLAKVFELVSAESVSIDGKKISGAILIKGKKPAAPFVILAQLHGNESAGLAGILLAMALAEAGRLEADVIGVIGNPLAAGQYFAAYLTDPKARQEKRDAYRCGLGEQGELLPDMNRIPVDFAARAPNTAHIKRAQELFALGQHCSGILDIHTARGNMTCITDHKREVDLKHSPIRSVLTDLASAISANASGATAVQTLKTILHPLKNIACHIGIEAGRHEAAEAPNIAASFTLSLLSTLGITPVTPLAKKDDGIFARYSVKPRLTYADLTHKPVKPSDKIYMARACESENDIPRRAGGFIVKKPDGSFEAQAVFAYMTKPAGKLHFVVYQYDEMEAIEKNQVVAVAIPSGVTFKAPHDFSGIFFSKSGKLYDKDPTVGPWPVAAGDIAKIKFCYPCDVSQWKLDF